MSLAPNVSAPISDSSWPPKAGFVTVPVGSHSSRSIMLSEVTRLFNGSPPEAPYQELRRLALEENILAKGTVSGRFETFRRLREFYALDPWIPIYRVLRLFWSYSPEERPLLAILCASARDPVLLASSSAVLGTKEGTVLAKATMEQYLGEAFPSRYSREVLAGMTRRILSSWTQSGHLVGRSVKVRRHPVAGPAATAYALFLGYLSGSRGNRLFETTWAAILDAPPADVHEYAFQASRRGWIDYRRLAGVIEVGFGGIYPRSEEAACPG